MIRRGQDVRRQRPDVSTSRRGGRPLQLGFIFAMALLVGCRQDMHDQPKYEPFEESDFFSDGRASRLQIAGTVARGQLREDSVFYQGLDADGALVQSIPIELDEAILARGRVVFDVYCSPCHDRTGSGNGMIVRRGFKRPESFHSPRLRQSPPGYLFQVMTNGFGEMSSYAAMIDPTERWAVAAYVRALQLSRAVPSGQLLPEDRAALAAESETEAPVATREAH